MSALMSQSFPINVVPEATAFSVLVCEVGKTAGHS